MKTLLFTRLKRLERATGADYPLSLLTDKELDVRIQASTAQIEACVGMPLASYVELLHEVLNAERPLPDNLHESEARAFIAASKRLPLTHGQEWPKDGQRNLAAAT